MHMCVIYAFIFRNDALIFKQGVKVTHVFQPRFKLTNLQEVFWLNQVQLLRTQLSEPEVCQQSTYALDKRGYWWLAYITVLVEMNGSLAPVKWCTESSAPWKLRELSEKRHFCQLLRVLLISRYVSSYMVKKNVNTLEQRRKRKWIDRQNNRQAFDHRHQVVVLCNKNRQQAVNYAVPVMRTRKTI